jgi:hypothetical protein
MWPLGKPKIHHYVSSKGNHGGPYESGRYSQSGEIGQLHKEEKKEIVGREVWGCKLIKLARDCVQSRVLLLALP